MTVVGQTHARSLSVHFRSFVILHALARRGAPHISQVPACILACHVSSQPVARRYGVFSKMQRKGASLEQVYDVRALRIIVKRKEDCYAALREVERLWTPVDGRFKVRTA